MFRHLSVSAVMLCVTAVQAQAPPPSGGQGQQIDPSTQIMWPRITGTGAPSPSTCGAANYGQPYVVQSTGAQYNCTPTGWVIPPAGAAGNNGDMQKNISGALGPAVNGTDYLNPGTGGTISGPINVTNLNGSPLQGLNYDAFGDSITFGFNASPRTNAWAYLVAAARKYTFAQTCAGVAGCNHGVPGDELPDMAGYVEQWTQPIQVSTVLIGQNDGCGGGSRGFSNWQNMYEATAAHLLTPVKIAANASGVTSTGTWTAAGAGYYAGAMQTTASGGTLVFNGVLGNVIYVQLESTPGSTALVNVTTDEGTLSQVVNFPLNQAWNSSRTNPPAPATHGPSLVRIPMLKMGAHTVTVTATTASSGSPVRVNWVAGNSGQQGSQSGPYVFFLYPTATTGVTEFYLPTCRASITAAIGALQSDGLGARIVDLSAACYATPTGGTPVPICNVSDGTHPDNAGHAIIAGQVMTAMDNFWWRPQRGDSMNGYRPAGTDGSTLIRSGIYSQTTNTTGQLQLQSIANKGASIDPTGNLKVDVNAISPQYDLTSAGLSGHVQQLMQRWSIPVGSGPVAQSVTATATFNSGDAYIAGYTCTLTLIETQPARISQQYVITGSNSATTITLGMIQSSYTLAGQAPLFLANPTVVSGTTGFTVDIVNTDTSATAFGELISSCPNFNNLQIATIAMGTPFTTVATAPPLYPVGQLSMLQPANTFMAGPATGTPAKMAPRTMQDADVSPLNIICKQDNSSAITGNGADQNVFSCTMPGNWLPASQCAQFNVWFQHTGSASVVYKWRVGALAITYGGATNASTAMGANLVLCNVNGSTSTQQGIPSQVYAGSGVASITQPATFFVDTTIAQTILFTFSVAATDTVTPVGFIGRRLSD